MLFRLLKFCFRLLPLDEPTRDRWRQRFLSRHPELVPAGPKGQLGPGTQRRARVRCDEAAIGHVERRHDALPSPLPATVVAFYLPQFHPIPENDAWWGRGFTEWRNVGRALPQFEGHAQPRLPADLGYYDLRNPETMRAQAALAADYGIGAFCFYFYWFSGTTLLEQPLRQWLADPSLQLPFCLCWANESWSRRWDGRSEDILIAQRHDPADDLAFIAHVADYLRDPRYLRVEGKPLLLVYRPGLLPDAKQTAARWREWCRNNGLGEIHIACVQGFERPDPRDLGFDSAVEFPPNLATPANLTARQRLLNPGYAGDVLDWRELADEYRRRPPSPYPLSPGVNCGWDNEPRRSGRGRVYLHASPRGYRDWLRDTISHRLAASPGRMVFVNAWNEWAEGAVLEPDARLGHAWLQATRTALREAAGAATEPGHVRPCVVVHAWHLEAFDEILAALLASGLSMRLLVTTAPEKADEVRAALARSGLNAEIEVFENRGRDILPFLHVANRLLDEGEELVLKLHTKHSPHRDDGDRWRRELLERLLAPARATRIFQAFGRDRGLGLVAPEGHVQPLHYFWGANQDNVAYAATRMGIAEPRAESDSFVSGSMFWVRLDALRPLLDAHFDAGEFEPEAAQVDGTFAHAIERVFALCARHRDLRVEEAAVVCGEPAAAGATGDYPYAARG
jgi:lipopolysaccharide biosynthesis protein